MNRGAENLFHELADLPPEQREAYYFREQVPPALRDEVEALLRFDTDSDQALADCVGAGAGHALQDAGIPAPAPASIPAGLRCGPYRLGQVLGRGGMGSVYLGERDDGEVQQRAAIKLLRFAVDESGFRQRFLRERRILAALNHPGITRLLDVGHTAQGQPFLAMEYIDGVPIDTFAADLDLRSTLNLFLDVCDAVSYAHRSLVIHRDLKPSNILVDRAGKPKLLDFGIAKILDSDSASDLTQTRERMLTPDFASPEQVRGEPQGTATDVYSLGAVLYRLLSGHSPHFFSSRAAGQIEEAICRRDPQPPSQIRREIPKDLDCILLKALRKEPGERYVSVDAFAGDLRALLEWRPVGARSGNAWYRMRKFARRYRVPVAAAALTLAALAFGLILANRERIIAERRFQQVRQLVVKTLELDSTIRGLPGSTKAREQIVSMSKNYLEGLGAEARSDQGLALEVADAYSHLASIQGVPTDSNLGHAQDAEASLKQAEDLYRVILKSSPHNRNALLAAAEAEQDLMILTQTDHRREEALSWAGQSAAHVDAFIAIAPLTDLERRNSARVLCNIALAYKNLHLSSESIRYARRAAEIARTGADADNVMSNALSILADSLRFSGDLDGALQAIEEARIRVERARFSSESMRRSSLHNVLAREGAILGQEGSISLNQPEKAVAVLRRAFDLDDLSAEQDPNDSRSRLTLGTTARLLGPILNRTDSKSALAVYDKALSRLREVKNNTDARRIEAEMLSRSSYALRRVNQPDEALRRINAAIGLLRGTKDFGDGPIQPESDHHIALAALADHLAATGQSDQAARIYQDMLDRIMDSKPNLLADLRDAISVADVYTKSSTIHRRIGKLDQAAKLDALRTALWQPWLRKLPGNPFILGQLAR